MGDNPKKYHITDDGIVFSVMEDGSVSEIGNVSSLCDNHKIGEQIQSSKSRKWMWIAIVSWAVLIVACVTFFVQHEAANEYILYLNNQNYDIEQNLTQVQSELDSKLAELDSVNQQINLERLNRMPITITGIQLANEDEDSRKIDDYGSLLYSNRVCYLRPKIYYTGRKTGTYNLIEKIIRPDGTVLHGDSSPNGATQKFSISSVYGKNGQYELLSWGWTDPGNYEAGTWTFEIWYDGIKIYSTNFIIQ